MFRLIHRYLAFTVGAVLLLQSLSGALLIIEKRIDRWLFEDFYGAAGAGQTPIGYDRVYRLVETARSDDRVVFIRHPDAHDGVYEVVLNDFTGERVYVDAFSGDVRGERSALAVTRNLLLVFHTGFLGGERLELAMGYAALIAVLMLISGLVVWSQGWRRRGLGFRWRLNSPRRLLLDTHRDLGLVTLPLLVFLILTGAAMIFHEWTESTLTAVTGQTGRPERPVASEDGPPALPLALDLDTLVRAARQAAGGAAPSFVSLPAKPGGTVNVRLRHAGEWHRNGRNMVVFDPADGRPMLVYNTRERNATQTLLDNIYPLHVGNFGGVPLQSAYFFSGVVAVYFFFTGLWVWWQRGKT